MGRKIITTVMSMVLVMSMCIAFAGCGSKAKTGIISLDFLAATGNADNPNTFFTYNSWGKYEFNKEKDEMLRSDKAMELIDVIAALPNVLGSEDEPLAYEIYLTYYDSEGVERDLRKNGYGGFPDNWKEIVKLVNEVTPGHKNVTDSTEIVTIDADFLRRNFDANDSMLPEGMTLEEYVSDTGLTYKDVFGSYYNIEIKLNDYVYDRLEIASHRIYENTEAVPSDYESLEAYAKENLDSITEKGEVSISGKFMDCYFDIVRFDCIDTWKKENGIDTGMIERDGTYDLGMIKDAGMEGMTYTEQYNVYTDPTGRFLIITRCGDYEVIYAFFNR